MNNNGNGNWARIVNVINEKNSFTICLPKNYSFDTLAAGTALYLGLNKIGKMVSISCSADIDMSGTNLTAVDKIQKSLTTNGDTLVISFPYKEGSVDKVTYNIEGDYFNILIQPHDGFPKLDPSAVKYSYTGGQVDNIITIDAANLNSLGDLYLKNQDQFRGKEIINIDRHLTNSNFGTINLIDRQRSSTSEIILTLLQYLNIEFDKEIATNLYAGLISATNNFTSYSVSAKTFEAAAQLLNFGANKRPMMTVKKPNLSFNHFSSSQPPVIDSNLDKTNLTQPPVFEVGPSIKKTAKKEMKRETKTPNDWLKPKIFHGGDIF